MKKTKKQKKNRCENAKGNDLCGAISHFLFGLILPGWNLKLSQVKEALNTKRMDYGRKYEEGWNTYTT